MTSRDRKWISNHRQQLVQVNNKETLKLCISGPWWWGYSTGDQWILLTKSQECGKCFHGITSSWNDTDTVECRYNAVQYSEILHTQLQELRQNINQMLDPQKNTTYLALRGKLWGVFCEYLWEIWPRHNDTALLGTALVIHPDETDTVTLCYDHLKYSLHTRGSM